ncbi:hypothetical protein Tco_1475014 [Tanacetum coccineum]
MQALVYSKDFVLEIVVVLASALQVLRRLGSIFTSVYAAVQKLKKAFDSKGPTSGIRAETISDLKPISGPKTIKSILKSKSTFKAETLKVFIIKEPILSSVVVCLHLIFIEPVYSTSFILHSESASGHDASADSTAEADPGLSAPNDSIPAQQDQTKSAGDGLKTAHADSGTNEESRTDDIAKKIKLEDLSDLLKDIRSVFFAPDSPEDEPIIISDESEEEVAKDKDTHASSHDKDELEQQKAKAEAEVASLRARTSYPDINQLTNLLVTSLKPEFSKLLASYDFASCLPNALKELPSKFTELSGEIKELKKHVQDMEIELLGDLKQIPTKLETFTSTISSLSSQVAELKNIQ